MPARKGNKNSLKHGIYSRHISIQDDEELAAMSQDNPADELALMRTRIRLLLNKQAEATALEDWLKLEALIDSNILSTANMLHANALLGRDQKQAFVTILDMIDVINREQHVK